MYKLNTIDSREITKHIKFLWSGARYHIDELDEDDALLVTELEALEKDAIENGCGESNWENGIEIINDNFIANYIRQKLEDDEILSRHYPSWLVIDWAETVDNFLKDYTELYMGHATFWVRTSVDIPAWHN